MDEVKITHMPYIGPGMWTLLHTFGIEATTDVNKDHFEYFIKILQSRIKCDHCLSDFNNFLETHPLNKYRNIRSEKGTEIGYYQWSTELHNHVNRKLRKPEIPMEKSYKFYAKKSNVCYSCGELPY